MPAVQADGRRSGRRRSSSTRSGSASARTFPPYLSIALGSAEATLLEVTSAYTVFPNQGVRMKPYDVLKVLDRDGNLLEENRPEPQDAIRADTAYVLTSLLRGVVLRGTAAAAGQPRVAARRQDGHDGRLHRRVVRRASIRRSRSACGSATTRRSRSAPARPGA